MIREDLSRGESSKPVAAHLSEGAAGAGKVTVEERQQRHGHRSAIFSVVGDRALAERLERSLFDRGFHAILVNDEQLSSTSLPSVLSALWGTGAVVIHSSASYINGATCCAWRSSQANSATIIDVNDQNHNVEEALKRALSIAETLRIDVASDR